MDKKIYTEEMAKSIWDKAFFMDKVIDTKCVVDFGCADGAMIRFLAPLFSSITFIGYDIDEELIEKGKEENEHSNVIFFNGNELDNLIEYVNSNFSSDEICLNFSCVLHEIFSSHKEGISTIYKLENELKPQYITIRDMYFDYNSNVFPLNDTFPGIEKFDAEKITDFERKHGSLTNYKNALHFLMKYQWKDNGWEQELEEDYFALDLSVLPLENYRDIFSTNYVLPYLQNKWKKEYDITKFYGTTHTQRIYERENDI